MTAIVPYIAALTHPKRVRAFDTETALFGPGLLAPPLACITTSTPQLDTSIHHWRDAAETAEELLSDALLLSLNAPYDLAVTAAQYPHLLPLVFDALKKDRVIDVGLAWQLRDIARGELGGHFEDLPAHLHKTRKGKTKTWRFVKHLYSVAGLIERISGEVVEKDEWRKKYGELRELPLVEWPEGARRYAMYDAALHMRIGAALVPEVQADDHIRESLDDVYAQTRASFFLHLMSCRGIRTDGEHCKLLVHECEKEIDRCRALCAGLQADFDYPDSFEPLVRGTDRDAYTGKKCKEGSKDTKRAAKYMLGALLRSVGVHDSREAREDFLDRLRHSTPNRFDEVVVELDAAEIKLSLTEGGAAALREMKGEKGRDVVADRETVLLGLSLAAQQCKDTADPVMRAYATYTSATTLRKRVERLSFGARGPLQPKYTTLKETGRTSCGMPSWPLVGDNVQNFRRSAMITEEGNELPGMREVIIPRPGYVLCSVDLDNAEMRAEAQIELWVCGSSRLAEVLNSDRCCHAALAAEHLLAEGAVPYEEFVRRRKSGDKVADNARQFAKIPNFALLGGAVGATMIGYAKQSGIILTVERALELERAFHTMWPEVSQVHNVVREAIRESDDGLIAVQQFISKRWRGGCRYTVARNGLFQALVGDAAKAAGLPLAEEGYSKPQSPFFGSYPLVFAHDEYIAEIPIGRNTTAAAWRMRDVILEAVAPYLPDVPPTAKPALMPRWYKGAELIVVDGEIKPWLPKPKK
jgi:hypothetical protein